MNVMKVLKESLTIFVIIAIIIILLTVLGIIESVMK